MTDEKLTSLLQRIEPPPAGAEQIRSALGAAKAALRVQPLEEQPPRRALETWRKGLNPAFFVAALAVMFVVGRYSVSSPNDSRAWNRITADSQKLLSETSLAFPDSLKAIVLDGKGSNLVLDAGGQRANSQPLLVEFSRGKEWTRALTFSGEKLRIRLGTGETTIEVFVDGNGEVSVVGDEFVWSSEHQSRPGGFQIRAQTLRTEL